LKIPLRHKAVVVGLSSSDAYPLTFPAWEALPVQAAQRNSITFHSMPFSRVPAVQHALALFLMAYVIRVTDFL